VDVDGEASLSGVATDIIGSEGDDTKDSISVGSSSSCFCDESDDDETAIGEGDSGLVVEIGAITGSCFQGSSTCSLTESNAADTQRS
jgi:hypothetical protein